jgi:hypothetical protein
MLELTVSETNRLISVIIIMKCFYICAVLFLWYSNIYFQRWASNLSLSNGKSSSTLNLNREVMIPGGTAVAGSAAVVGFCSALYSVRH